MNYKRIAFQLSVARAAGFLLIATGILHLLSMMVLPAMAFYLLLFIVSVVLFCKGWGHSYKWDILTLCILVLEASIILFIIFVYIAFAVDDRGWSFG